MEADRSPRRASGGHPHPALNVCPSAGGAGRGAGGAGPAAAPRGPISWATLLVTPEEGRQLTQARWAGELDLALLPAEGNQ